MGERMGGGLHKNNSDTHSNIIFQNLDFSVKKVLLCFTIYSNIIFYNALLVSFVLFWIEDIIPLY
jgi:hypothetical protein